MANPILHRLMLALTVVLLVTGGALAQCSEGQMAEAQLQFQGAQSLLQAQQWAQAVPQLQSIVEFCPEYFPALRGLGMAYEKMGDYDQAAASYGQVVAIMGPDTEAADFGNLARVFTRQKKYKEARAEYLKAKARDPHHCAVLVNLGMLHDVSGYPTMAVDTLEDALAFCPDMADRIHAPLAKACTNAAAQQKKIGNAESAAMYTRKAQEYGGSAGGTTAYAQIQDRMNARDYPGTIKLCDQLLAKEPNHANALLTKARAADQTGQQAVAIDAYTKYLALRPDNVSETAAMIIVMAESGQCDRAVTAARTAGQKFAGLGHKALGKIDFAHGKALFCAKDYAGSKRQFEKAARSGDPNWVGPAREGISACDQYINYEAQQLKQGN